MPKSTPPRPASIDPEVLAPDDMALVVREVTELQTFKAELRLFFRAAGDLQSQAIVALEEAQAAKLRPPTTPEEDAIVQSQAQACLALDDSIAGHWEIKTALFHNLHKRFVAGRKRGTELVKQAYQIYNDLHNTFAEAKRREAARQAEEERKAREDKARKDRDDELRRLDDEATRREEATTELSEREQAFVAAYTSSIGTRGDGQASAERAGFRDPFKAAARLLALDKIRRAIEDVEAAIKLRAQASAIREQPLAVEAPRVESGVKKVAPQKTTWTAELLDERALIEAIVAGKHGIPLDVLTVSQVKLNEYARAMNERIDLWPGVRAKKTTRIV